MTEPLSSKSDTNPQSSPPPKPTTHKAHCHCSAVRFTVTLEARFPTYKITKCNCSICTKNGYLLVYPARKDVVWTQGYDNLTEYYFGEKKKAHKFCRTCGTSILIDFKRNEYGVTDPDKDQLAVRIFADIDLDNDDLDWEYFDGKALLHPQYGLDA